MLNILIFLFSLFRFDNIHVIEELKEIERNDLITLLNLNELPSNYWEYHIRFKNKFVHINNIFITFVDSALSSNSLLEQLFSVGSNVICKNSTGVQNSKYMSLWFNLLNKAFNKAKSISKSRSNKETKENESFQREYINQLCIIGNYLQEIYDREKKNIPSRSSISKSNKHQEDAVMKETAIVSDMNITRINGPNDKRKYGGNEIQKGIENINTWQEENKLGIQQKLSTLPVLNQTNFKFKDVIQKEILNKFRS